MQLWRCSKFFISNIYVDSHHRYLSYHKLPKGCLIWNCLNLMIFCTAVERVKCYSTEAVSSSNDLLIIYELKCKQGWSTIPPISTKRTMISHLKLLNTKQTTTYNVRNPGPGLWQDREKTNKKYKHNTIQKTKIMSNTKHQVLAKGKQFMSLSQDTRHVTHIFKSVRHYAAMTLFKVFYI
jgi:hypothetical protein